MSTFTVVILLIVAAGLLAIALFMASFGLGAFWGAPYVGTPARIVRRMLRLAEVMEGETLVDLGSGAGNILIVAAREFGLRAIGYELNPLLRILTCIKARLAGVSDRVEVRSGNLLRVPLPQADVFTVFLLPSLIERLKPKLQAELDGSTRVVARDFPFKDWPHFAEDGYLRAYRIKDVL